MIIFREAVQNFTLLSFPFIQCFRSGSDFPFYIKVIDRDVILQ